MHDLAASWCIIILLLNYNSVVMTAEVALDKEKCFVSTLLERKWMNSIVLLSNQKKDKPAMYLTVQNGSMEIGARY